MRILNAAPGFIAPLTEDEINKFLTESKLPHSQWERRTKHSSDMVLL